MTFGPPPVKPSPLSTISISGPCGPPLSSVPWTSQNGLYTLDDIFAMRQKKSQQLDVCLKRHLTKRFPRHDAPPCASRKKDR